MPFWIELHCGARVAGPRCHAEEGCPGELSHDTTAAVASTMRTITDRARAHGWRRMKAYGWVCPACVASFTR